MKKMNLAAFLLAALALMPGSLEAQRNLRKAPKPDPAAELREFQPAEGFEVNLFAANPMIAKPINMNFDARGRLWVASSGVYPHIKPGQVPIDSRGPRWRWGRRPLDGIRRWPSHAYRRGAG